MITSFSALAETVGEMAANAETYTLPLSTTNETLTVYIALRGSIRYTSAEEHPVIKKIEELTGVNLEFVHPPESDDGTFFSTLIASGNYPDIFINFKAGNYPGGIQGAINDGVLMDIDGLVRKDAPNFLKLIAEKGDAAYKSIVDDEGKFTHMGIRFDPPVLFGKQHVGLIIRQDLLNAVGMSVPNTMAELENVLLALKEKLNIEYPLGLAALNNYTNSNWLTAAYGVALDGFQLDEDGNVCYSRIMDAYKDALINLHRWYEEGLFDRDFANRTKNDAIKLLYNDRAAVVEIGCNNAAEVMKVGTVENSAFEIAPLMVPRLNSADETLNVCNPRTGIGLQYWTLSATCKNPELAVRLLDWLYSDEALILTNFGIGDKGDGNVTYVKNETNGRYEFSDYMLHNSELAFDSIRQIETYQELQTQYHNDFISQEYDTPIQQACWNVWSTGVTRNRLLPANLTLNPEESAAHLAVYSDIQSYTDEMIYKFICGELDIETNWNAYVQEVQTMGLQDSIDAYTAAMTRYNNR